MDILIRHANLGDLEQLVGLFELYREFYKKPGQETEARVFLHERLARNESVVFVAERNDGKLIGFAQLYPSFTSLGLRRAWVLNDLYVIEDARRTKVASRLMAEVHAYARLTKAAYIQLETAKDNIKAQKLYASLGYVPEEHYLIFSLPLV